MSKWHKTADKFPLPGEDVEITHPQFRGTRTAKMDTLLCPHWVLTDCTHPEQNCYIPMEDSAWRSLSVGISPNSLMHKENPEAGRLLRIEIHAAIRRMGLESEITMYQAIGALRVVEHDLILIMDRRDKSEPEIQP